MRFLVVTLAPTLLRDKKQQSYAPYVKEMDMWFSKVDGVTIVSPTEYASKLLLAPFQRNDIRVVSIPSISFNNLGNCLLSLVNIPLIFLKLLQEMAKADHIHLRCPATIVLIGCITQVFFPKKTKTAKYAGNWDPKAKQPLSYRFQKWLLGNTFFTKNMQVLVYGEWPKQSKNIKSFFTATYRNKKISETATRAFNSKNNFLFVGSLVSGKRPLYAVKFVEALFKSGVACSLSMYGDGAKRKDLEAYIIKNNLTEIVRLFGNQPGEIVEDAYKKAQFLLLPSKSEGWPKVVAEAMFWGVVPIVTKISCVPWMLDYGDRGFLIDAELETDVSTFLMSLENRNCLNEMSKKGMEWSHSYTLDDFEAQIKELV